MEIFTKMTYIAVIPIYLFYFLSSNRNLLDDLDKELILLSSSVREDVIFLIREFVIQYSGGIFPRTTASVGY